MSEEYEPINIVDGNPELHEDDFGEEDELCFDGSGGTDEDRRFDEYVGALEEVVMDEAFQRAQDKFVREHCMRFEDTEENKLEYTSIFESYLQLIEETLESKMTELVPNFSMEEFMEMLSSRSEELDGDIFDTLLACTDFTLFKEHMLSFKRGSSWEAGGVQVAPFVIHMEEEEEGEQRPDLNLSISSAFRR